MKCEQCLKRNKVCIPCSSCYRKSLCTGCIQLESHNCFGLLNKVFNEIEKIRETNPVIKKDKVQRL